MKRFGTTEETTKVERDEIEEIDVDDIPRAKKLEPKNDKQALPAEKRPF